MKNMEVVITQLVKQKIDEYVNSLFRYPISLDRVFEKKTNMINALLSIGQTPNACPTCIYKDLGQVFNRRKKLIYTSLHRFNYEDESGFQWAFAYVATDKSVVITKMIPANQVKESTERLIQESIRPILDIQERWNRLRH